MLTAYVPRDLLIRVINQWLEAGAAAELVACVTVIHGILGLVVFVHFCSWMSKNPL